MSRSRRRDAQRGRGASPTSRGRRAARPASGTLPVRIGAQAVGVLLVAAALGVVSLQDDGYGRRLAGWLPTPAAQRVAGVVVVVTLAVLLLAFLEARRSGWAPLVVVLPLFFLGTLTWLVVPVAVRTATVGERVTAEQVPHLARTLGVGLLVLALLTVLHRWRRPSRLPRDRSASDAAELARRGRTGSWHVVGPCLAILAGVVVALVA